MKLRRCGAEVSVGPEEGDGQEASLAGGRAPVLLGQGRAHFRSSRQFVKKGGKCLAYYRFQKHRNAPYIGCPKDIQEWTPTLKLGGEESPGIGKRKSEISSREPIEKPPANIQCDMAEISRRREKAVRLERGTKN